MLSETEIEKRFPKFSFQFTKSFENILDSDFDFSKIDLRITHEIPFLSGQNTSLIFQSGFAFGNVPLTHLYSIAPNNLNRETLFKRITFAGKNSFEPSPKMLDNKIAQRVLKDFSLEGAIEGF